MDSLKGLNGSWPPLAATGQRQRSGDRSHGGLRGANRAAEAGLSIESVSPSSGCQLRHKKPRNLAQKWGHSEFAHRALRGVRLGKLRKYGRGVRLLGRDLRLYSAGVDRCGCHVRACQALPLPVPK